MKFKPNFLAIFMSMVIALMTPTIVFASESDNNDDYLHTDGSKIYDSLGNEVRLTGIAWFGNETPNGSYHGLWANTLDDILDKVADNGFNTLRVPLSVQLVNEWRQGNYPMPDSINDYVNPDLKNKNSLEILDKSILTCKKKGIKVMLDMHRIINGSQSNLWYTDKYSVEDYEECWKWLANHYKNDDTVIAMDIFNEPHGKAYRQEQAAKWDESTDIDNWKYEAEKVGKEILDINPNLLIMVEGIETYPKEGFDYSTKAIDNYYGTWWGGNLRGVQEHPVNIENHPNQVVYSPHDYGPGVSMQPWFENGFTKESLLKEAWEPNWFYIQDKNIAPLLVGEWGGNMDGSNNQKWMQALADFITEKNINHTFWCLNPNSGDTGGILGYDFKTVDTAKMALVKPTLWQEKESGKFIGLDHKVNLGKNGTHVGGNTVIDPVINKGDINDDGKVDITDYIVLQKYIMDTSNKINTKNADMNEDGRINTSDLFNLKKLLLE
ncbi:endoglucanase E1 precursor [Clostridium puniceum]|uniref:cellulase n=1 Tax=Clostridium puniceum TaxID=29367 RepID=A0A1S8TP89_9CLOT|nr:cellulase family glycosylhydrolase [Clostridium puniceum]OOM79587.1 endoglucanase E1 precursor [Clostridium puniceum]